jgi:polysaccharide biosynthesis protein PslH
MQIVYLSHCVPWPPDKGDRIRAFHALCTLVQHHDVHVACFARNEREAAVRSALQRRCASVYIEPLPTVLNFARAATLFTLGRCFITSFYQSQNMRSHVDALMHNTQIDAVITLSSAMLPYARPEVPLLADLCDLDSEKWLEYARVRVPRFAFRFEAYRLRQIERMFTQQSRCTFLITPQELTLFRMVAPTVPGVIMGNGVDCEFFNPATSFSVPANLARRNFLVFTGHLDYFPNRDGIMDFVENTFPEMRRRNGGLELLLVGPNPPRDIKCLNGRHGVTVTGEVDDVRPYLQAARAAIAPLRIARGMQNKVLEALAMGKPVLASAAVCRAFGFELPLGVVRCTRPADYWDFVLPQNANAREDIREAARERFSWAQNMSPLIAQLAAIERTRKGSTRCELGAVLTQFRP